MRLIWPGVRNMAPAVAPVRDRWRGASSGAWSLAGAELPGRVVDGLIAPVPNPKAAAAHWTRRGIKRGANSSRLVRILPPKV